MTNTGKKASDFTVGDPVTYIPNHADNDFSHADCEQGHVSTIKPEQNAIWVRFKAACGAKCDPTNLI